MTKVTRYKSGQVKVRTGSKSFLLSASYADENLDDILDTLETRPSKTCGKCGTVYTSLEGLTYIGGSDMGEFYDCPCKSTLTMTPAQVRRLKCSSDK